MNKIAEVFILTIFFIGIALTPLCAEVIGVTTFGFIGVPLGSTTTVKDTVILINQTSGDAITGLKTNNFKFFGRDPYPSYMTFSVTEVGGGVYTISYTPQSGQTWPNTYTDWHFVIKITDEASSGAYLLTVEPG